MDGDGRYLWMGMGGTCGWGWEAPVDGDGGGPCGWGSPGDGVPVDADGGGTYGWGFEAPVDVDGEGRGVHVDGEAGRGRPGVPRDG